MTIRKALSSILLKSSTLDPFSIEKILFFEDLTISIPPILR